MDIINQLTMGMEGFNQANEETLQYLSKALTAGTGVDAAAFTGGRALTPENLDTTLVNILWSQTDAVLFKKLKKQPIPSPVYQWDTRTGVGSGAGAWVSEGGSSQDTDQTIARAYTTAKYLQTRRTVTLQASVSNMIENAIALEKNAGMLWLIQQVELALFNGNSTYNSYEPDGLKAQIPAGNVIDMRGVSANSDTFATKMERASQTIRQSYGKPTDIFCSTMTMTDVQQLLRTRIRFGTGTEQMGGAVFMKYPTPFGDIELNPNIFLLEGQAPSASGLSGAPDICTFTTSNGAQSGSLFGASDAGTYYYIVVGINQYGQGIASAAGQGTANAGDGITLAVSKGSITPTAYMVFRGQKNGVSTTDLRYAFTVAYTGSPMNIIDKNENLPGCSDAYVLNLDTMFDAIEFAQFLPAMKFDLYPTNAAVYPFLMLLFGALAVKKTTQHVRIKNIQPSSLGWF